MPFIAGLALFVIAGVFFLTAWQGEKKTQPIEYNHSKHIKQGLECIDCHQFFKTESFAGLPKIEVCLTCHQEAVTKSPEEEKIRVFAGKNKEIPWVSIYKQPGHVFFSHRRHVVLGWIECSVCHGNMEKMEKPPQRPAVKLTMGNCITCHKKNKVSTDCNACHR